MVCRCGATTTCSLDRYQSPLYECVCVCEHNQSVPRHSFYNQRLDIDGGGGKMSLEDATQGRNPKMKIKLTGIVRGVDTNIEVDTIYFTDSKEA